MFSLSIIYGLLILLLLPLAFHLAAFQKSTKFVHVLISLLVGEYVLTVFMMVFGFLHLFDAKWILIASLFFVSVLGRYIKEKEIAEIDYPNVSRVIIGLALFFALFLLVIQEHIPYLTDAMNDAMDAYFPWARIIVQERSIPPFHLENNVYFAIFKQPVLYTHLALLFSSQGNYSLEITRSLPIFYATLTVLLLLNWGREHGNRFIPWFIVISLFGVWPYIPTHSIFIIEEMPLLFFTTSSFYLLFQYWRTKRNIFLISLAMASSLAALTKNLGFLTLILVLIGLFMRIEDKREISKIATVFLVLGLPTLAWSFRSLYFYDHLFFTYDLSSISQSMVTFQSIERKEVFIKFLKDVIVCFPALLFSVLYMYENRRNPEARFLLLAVLLVFSFLFLVNDLRIRHILLLTGVLALYSGVKLSQIYDPIQIPHKKAVLASVLIFLVAFSFFRITNHYASFDPYYCEKEIADYILENELSGGSVYIWSTRWSSSLIWYANATIILPNSRHFLELSHGRQFEYGRGSEYYHSIFKEIGIAYVYSKSKETPADIEAGRKIYERIENREIYEKINDDEKNFDLVYDKNGLRLWRVLD